MDLDFVLNPGTPQSSSAPSTRLPPQNRNSNHSHSRPAPPPLQPPQTSFQSGGYSHSQSQPRSPYHPSPTSASRQFPPPPSPSPHAQQQHHQQQGYGQSPSTPHPLSAASRHSATPTSSVSTSSQNHFPPPGQHPQYGHSQQQQQQQIPQPHQQHQQHHNQIQPPPSPHQYHSPHQQHSHPHSGFPRQSPLASPIGGRPPLTHSLSNSVNERSTPTIPPPVPRDQRDKERERERARENRERIERSERVEREREQWEREQRDREQRDRDRERERERERRGRERERERREMEIDRSVSPKTKLPPHLLAEDPTPDSGIAPKEEFGYVRSKPNSQQLPDGPSGCARRDSSVVTTPSQERRSVDVMDLDGGSGVTPGPVLGTGQKWGSPVLERAIPNGAISVDGRDSQGPHHLAPQQQQPQPTQPPSNSNSNSNLSQQPSSQPSSGASSQRTSTVSPSNKEQPHQPPSSLTPQTKKSTPTPTPTNINPRHPPPQSSSSPKGVQQLGPPPTPSHNQAIVEGGNSSGPGSSGPPKKRARRDEAPIWARKASRSSSSSPVLANRRQPSSANQHQPPQQQQPPSLPPPPPQQHQKPPLASGFTPRFVPYFGAWEPSICNTEPYEELTREVANFLFGQVVCRNDPALTPSGGDGPVAMIEIEAKIGHLIDKERGERLKLPVVTETVLNVDEPGWKIQFKSSMTEAQHKRLNIFLNRQFSESKGPPPPGMPPSPSSEHSNENSRPPTGPQRIPMDYVHTRERDTFFELPPDKFQALPNILRSYMRHKPKVRVTFDQKTGKAINKIIKTRIADLNVYSPKTAFDWRVSANIEMPYLGDIDGLQPSSDRGGGDRNKDRLSYRHLAYQIDLTQVTDNTAKKEHELEVEVSGQEIIRHGNLVKEGKPNAYESLVRGFVDNVRVLIRAIEP